jgi:hypothetical protein
MNGCNNRSHYTEECEEKCKDMTDEVGENKIRQLKASLIG